VVDHVRGTPVGTDDIVAGLRARLRDPEFGASLPRPLTNGTGGDDER
jgi:hypothetical protein